MKFFPPMGAAFAACVLVSTAAGGSFEYLHDNGTTEESVGSALGAEIAWINRFDTQPGFETIVSISTAFGSAEDPPGLSGVIGGITEFEVWLWSDDDDDGYPGNGTTLLYTSTEIAEMAAVQTNALQTIAITPTLITTNQFFVGISIRTGSGTFPGPVDISRPSLGDSWFTSDLDDFTGMEPMDASPTGLGFADLDSLVEGVWMLRANGAVPTPGALALLGLAALVRGRRRAG